MVIDSPPHATIVGSHSGADRETTLVSVLFPDRVPPLEPEPPAYFRDLNLDQVLERLIAGRTDYELAPYFHTRLTDARAVGYRQAVFADLDADADLRRLLDEFATAMTKTRQALGYAHTVHNAHERDGLHLHAALLYVTAVESLSGYLTHATPSSVALMSLTRALRTLTGSTEFAELTEHVHRVADELYALVYCLDLSGDRVRVSRFEDEIDYETQVRAVFAKFDNAQGPRPTHDFHSHVDLNWVEAKILDLVAKLHPDQFTSLAHFCDHHREFLDPQIVVFDQEIQFYRAVLHLRDQLTADGLPWCTPVIATDGKDLTVEGLYDLALATKLTSATRKTVVGNDIDLHGEQLAIVVTGPNQGGKTTFARAFGQLYHLAALGMPVPGRSARIRLCDQLFTCFERSEDLDTLSGKLDDDLHRVHAILTHASGESVVVMNESFTSTTLADARVLGGAVLRELLGRGIRCVYVTFVDELSRLSPATVSMVAAVDPHNPAVRTFRIERRTADGLAYAAALAQLHHLTYQRISERIRR